MTESIPHTTIKKSVFKLTLVRFALAYCFVWICIAHSIDIFQPLTLEVSISLIACCIIPLLIHYFDYQHLGTTYTEIRWQNFKLHFWASIIFLLAVPFFSSDKISALNYPISSQAKNAVTPISGFIDFGQVRIPTHRQPVQGIVFTHQESQQVICDLLTRKKCPYTEQFGQGVTLQLSTRDLWPYRKTSVIFDFKSNDVHFDKAQHIQFYKQQQYAVVVYFIFIFFPSFWIFYRLRQVLLAHYFQQSSANTIT